jgi:hypothetical protein
MINDKVPTCFIAMAFGKEDSEALYEKSILPVLQRNLIKPIIINRQNSNEDLNNQIIDELSMSDFCIVDLTYARPSVYFEAGYAQRSIEVIYTCRKDHFNKNQPDDLRVHFDLQMKPIISWERPDDQMFSDQLEKRIFSTFLSEWKDKVKENEERQAEKDKFSKLPLASRLSKIRGICIKFLNIRDYEGWSPVNTAYMKYFPDDSSVDKLLNGEINQTIGYKKKPEGVDFAIVHSYQEFNQSSLTGADLLNGEIDFLEKVITENQEIKYNEVIFFQFILSLSPLDVSIVEEMFPRAEVIEKGRIYFQTILFSFSKVSNIGEYILLFPNISAPNKAFLQLLVQNEVKINSLINFKRNTTRN